MSLKTIFFSDSNCHKVINKFIDVHFTNSGKLLLKDDPDFLKNFKKTFIQVFNESANALPTKSPAELSESIAKLNTRSIRVLEDIYSEPAETLLEDLPEPVEAPVESTAQTPREVPAQVPVQVPVQVPMQVPVQVPLLKKRVTIDKDMIENGKVELMLTRVSEIELDSMYFKNCVPNVSESDLQIRYNLGGASKELFTEWTTVHFVEGYYQTRDLIQTLQKGCSFGNYTFSAHIDDISGKLVFRGTVLETVKKPNSLATTAESRVIGFEMKIPQSLCAVLGVNEDNISSNGVYYCKLQPFSSITYSLKLSIPEIDLESQIPLDVPFGSVKWYCESRGVNSVFSNPRDISELTLEVSCEKVLECSFELSFIVKKYL